MSPDKDYSKWEHIIAEVEKTNVPLECIHKLVLRLEGNRQKTINVRSLFNQGLSEEEIEVLVQRVIDQYSSIIRKIDFTLDIEAVVDLVQPETDKLFKKAKL